MGDKKTESGGEILFYCKDCEKIVKTDRCGRKYVYKCKKCGTKNVAFGTEKSIYSFFRLEDKKVEKKEEEKQERKGSSENKESKEAEEKEKS